ncbi:Fc.00g056600.m01.CDS01 [Cosmosporella sp. VM-42]
MNEPEIISTKAYVLSERGGPFVLTDVILDEVQLNEVLVEIKYTGLCHTDIAVQQGGMPISGYPVVLGHEGIGIVRRVGPTISDKLLCPGDTVILSFHSCRQCRACYEERYGCCPRMTEVNFTRTARQRTSPRAAVSLPDGLEVHSQFFGQSSLSKFAIVTENSVVRISAQPEEIAFLAPLACGYLTGAGTILNVLRPRNDTKVAIIGMGAVGLAAMLAAKAVGVQNIVAIDILDVKLEKALSLGASHTINTRGSPDINTEMRKIFPEGVDQIMDTTGVISLLQQAVKALSHEGTLALVGIAPKAAKFEIDALDLLLSCKSIMGVIEGYSNPQKVIPQLLDLYHAGNFPIDKISKQYPAECLDEAIEDLKLGRVIKPILSWENVN